MRTRITAALVLPAAIAAVLAVAPAAADDPARGRLLYENHCDGCHTSRVHIRENRKARSMDDLRYWVRLWSGQLDLPWREEEIADVAAHLAARHYDLRRID